MYKKNYKNDRYVMGVSIASPGVYINEVSGLAPPVVPVATAVPAFIGYTPQALFEGISYTNVPHKITSFAEFMEIYCFPELAQQASSVKQYNPEYYMVLQKSQSVKGEYLLIEGAYYSVVPDPDTIYYLYNSILLFYLNGGGDAYIVSVGSYGAPSKKPMDPGDKLVNANVQLNDLMNGLAILKNEQEVTLYLCPEATLLSVENNGTLMQSMLLQCTEVKTAVSIFDLIGGRNPDPILYTNDITTFRNNTGALGLSYGTAYYPFIGTTLMENWNIDYTNLFGGDTRQLELLLNPANNPDPGITAIFADIENPASGLTVIQNNTALINASKTYSLIVNQVLTDANILPLSGAIAGWITTVDNNQGVWHTTADQSIVGAVSLPILLSDSQQGNLNMDAVSGKSINVIRFFKGYGILVWGARTLDGYSLNWKYLSVRRTMIFLEQSCKLAAQAYVLEPNDQNTWEGIKAVISSFLTSIWNDGGLQGAIASEAFIVQCGLGSSMTPEDISNGFLKFIVEVAVVRPAEFIVMTFEQQQATSG